MTDAPGYPHLPPALDAERRETAGPAGRMSYYAAGEGPPLLLVHSVNAAASAYEVKPIFDRLCAERTVYAIDLPGFGFSDRPDRLYTPRIMTDAVAALAGEIRRRHGAPPDALALSLGSEFLARAAAETPGLFRSLALVSPTGMDRRGPYEGPDGATRAMPALRAIFNFPLWSRGFFSLLTSRPSIRYFLRKTFGSRDIDEGLFEYAWLTSHQPGARHAPYCFVSGYLFSADITRVYRSLGEPVWAAHGVRGDFTDYSGKAALADRPNWSFATFQTGALPQFEVPEDFVAAYRAFLAGAAGAPTARSTPRAPSATR